MELETDVLPALSSLGMGRSEVGDTGVSSSPMVLNLLPCGDHKMIEDWFTTTYWFSDHISRMKTHLYLLLLAAGISAAPQKSSMAELLTLLQQMCEMMTKDIQNLRIETPNNIDDSEFSSSLSKQPPTGECNHHPSLSAWLPSHIPSPPSGGLVQTTRSWRPKPVTALWQRTRMAILGMGQGPGNERVTPVLISPGTQESDVTGDVNCISTIFKGTEQLKNNPAMKKFSVFFQNFERLKQWLVPNLAKEGKCDTERRSTIIFIKKLMTFIRKVLKTTRRES
ncbi:hypothetical protein DV515_00006961 [Chloebia gouldiae]|uniref:Interleukin-5 n=1 Tax=Chloebia gouldiae TaxID=44316 RepID=A0A3L8SJV7_CHLGU|nr:hypothetical protein DV515_00006961 [Chloebia gouldiae]